MGMGTFSQSQKRRCKQDDLGACERVVNGLIVAGCETSLREMTRFGRRCGCAQVAARARGRACHRCSPVHFVADARVSRKSALLAKLVGWC